MTKVLTVRVSAELLDKVEAKAVRLGMERSKYLRSLMEEDANADFSTAAGQFASEDLVGSVPAGKGPYTNERIRKLVRAKWFEKREKNC